MCIRPRLSSFGGQKRHTSKLRACVIGLCTWVYKPTLCAHTLGRSGRSRWAAEGGGVCGRVCEWLLVNEKAGYLAIWLLGWRTGFILPLTAVVRACGPSRAVRLKPCWNVYIEHIQNCSKSITSKSCPPPSRFPYHHHHHHHHLPFHPVYIKTQHNPPPAPPPAPPPPPPSALWSPRLFLL
jgi:hypothetical protein